MIEKHSVLTCDGCIHHGLMDDKTKCLACKRNPYLEDNYIEEIQ